MKTKIVRVCGLALIALLTPAITSAAPMRYDCDTPAGAFSLLNQVQKGPTYTFRAELIPKQFRDGGQFAPTATIRILSPDGESGFGVQLSQKGAELGVVMFIGRAGKFEERPLKSLKLGERLGVSIEVQQGTLRGKVGDTAVNVPLKLGQQAELAVSCSTGQFVFEDLDFGSPR